MFLVVLGGGSLEQTGHGLVYSAVVRTPVGINSVEVWGLQTRLATAASSGGSDKGDAAADVTLGPRGVLEAEEKGTNSPQVRRTWGRSRNVVQFRSCCMPRRPLIYRHGTIIKYQHPHLYSSLIYLSPAPFPRTIPGSINYINYSCYRQPGHAQRGQ